MATYDLVLRKTPGYPDEYSLVTPAVQYWFGNRPFRGLSLSTEAWPFPTHPNRLEIQDPDLSVGQDRPTVECQGNQRACHTKEFWLFLHNPDKPGDVAFYSSESITEKGHPCVNHFRVEKECLGEDRFPYRLKIILSNCNQSVGAVVTN